MHNKSIISRETYLFPNHEKDSWIIDFGGGHRFLSPYNEQRNNPVISFLFRSINILIRNNKKFKYSLAPYIVLYLHP